MSIHSSQMRFSFNLLCMSVVIALSSLVSGRAEADLCSDYLMTSTTHLENVTIISKTNPSHSNIFYSSPSWSSDGKKLAVVVSEGTSSSSSSYNRALCVYDFTKNAATLVKYVSASSGENISDVNFYTGNNTQLVYTTGKGNLETLMLYSTSGTISVYSLTGAISDISFSENGNFMNFMKDGFLYWAAIPNQTLSISQTFQSISVPSADYVMLPFVSNSGDLYVAYSVGGAAFDVVVYDYTSGNKISSTPTIKVQDSLNTLDGDEFGVFGIGITHDEVNLVVSSASYYGEYEAMWGVDIATGTGLTLFSNGINGKYAQVIPNQNLVAYASTFNEDRSCDSNGDGTGDMALSSLLIQDLDSGEKLAAISSCNVPVSLSLTVSKSGKFAFTTKMSGKPVLAIYSDQDFDAVSDDVDNCIIVSNSDQVDGDGDGIGKVCDPNDTVSDSDGDGDLDNVDNCISISNADQKDTDLDGIGDVCEDTDGDGKLDTVDKCPNNVDSGVDLDVDGIDDVCDTDKDGDGKLDATDDNCPSTKNPAQEDMDLDKVGDHCDDDLDGDLVSNTVDNCPYDKDSTQKNTDQAGVNVTTGPGDVCDTDHDNIAYSFNTSTVVPTDYNKDNCKLAYNPDQTDTDADKIGDACEGGKCDQDGDGYYDATDGTASQGVNNNTTECQEIITSEKAKPVSEQKIDNCPINANNSQLDDDGDGKGDACDNDDIDADGIRDLDDNCPEEANPDQKDSYGSDGQGDVCGDADDDGDPDLDDNCPIDGNSNQSDIDEDGKGDACDGDKDGDGIRNEDDNCSSEPNEDQDDDDEDGTGDECESSSDNLNDNTAEETGAGIDWWTCSLNRAHGDGSRPQAMQLALLGIFLVPLVIRLRYAKGASTHSSHR